MTFRFQCAAPGCGKTIKSKKDVTGKKVKCPACGTSQVVQAPSALTEVKQRPQKTCNSCGASVDADELSCPKCDTLFVAGEGSLPATGGGGASRGGNVRDPGKAAQYYSAMGAQRIPQRFDTKEEAEQALAALEDELPAVKSAYQPSGAFSEQTLTWMVVGAFAGAPAGLAAGLIACALSWLFSVYVGLYVVSLLFRLEVAIEASTLDNPQENVRQYLSALATFVNLFWLLLTSIIGGAASGSVVAMLGAHGKNRNPVVAVVFSVLSAVMGGLLFVLVLSLLPMHVWLATGHISRELGLLGGFLMGALTAAWIAYSDVAGSKFCEACNAWMESTDLPALSLGGARVAQEIFRDRQFGAIRDLTRFATGRDCAVQLCYCAKCQRGYLEATLHFPNIVDDDEDEDEAAPDEEWLIASSELTPEETRQVRGLDALADKGHTPSPSDRQCPSCQALVAQDAVLCVACGWNFQTQSHVGKA